jgi:FAD:protein FMN transferase
VGESLTVHPHTATVLHAAAALHASTQGLFDITLGSAPQGWQLQGRQLTKHHAHVALDLGGIAKGHAVDCAVAALQAAGCTAGWVNAGGDLRTFGDIDVPIALRNEQQGGTHAFGTLRNGALATSHYGPGARASLWAGGASGSPTAMRMHRHVSNHISNHVSVLAPQCLWADALTKVVALTGNPHHAALAAHGAQAWLH